MALSAILMSNTLGSKVGQYTIHIAQPYLETLSDLSTYVHTYITGCIHTRPVSLLMRCGTHVYILNVLLI